MADLSQAHSIEDLRRLAQRRLPRAMFDFIDGGAEDELTLRANRAAFERLKLRPRVLVDVSQLDTQAEVLGAPAPLPLAISPTGMSGVAWPKAELEIARAAAKRGIAYTLATPASSSIEEVAREVGDRLGGRLWFQLYVLRHPEILERLVARALAAGYEALVVTVDLAAGGKRERDPRNGLAVPLRPNRRNVTDLLSHPRWLAQMLIRGLPQFANLLDLVDARGRPGGIVAFVANETDSGFDCTKLARLRERWPKKLVVKGVQRGDDAGRAVAAGADAIVVSNHGGRQLDGARASLEVLPEVVQAVGGRVPVLIDGGVRRGADLVKARLLGAQAAMIGRATLYGAAVAGEAGAERALAILSDEFERTMRLCGARSLAELTPDLITALPPSG
ncbi:MAG: alpha-hydroxy-acid oxidizing protein [Betaproteobacteria bacterium]|nr:MAG: alpha-hydroxy-acid oxidizing protein [Betaproteobacteria bacterium]